MRREGCEELLLEFCAYVDGELTRADCQKIEAHLRSCEDCTAVVNTLRKTIELYRRRRIVGPLPADTRRRLFKGLNLEDTMER